MLRLFGYPTLETASEKLELAPHKPICLLLYLAMQQTWVSREVLATLFWPDADEEGARRNLRMMLSRAKELDWAKGLDISPLQLRWSVESDYKAFREALGAGDWQTVIDLHSQTLLEGWRVPGVAGFEVWLELERESLLDSWREAAMHQVRELQAKANYESVCLLLSRVLTYEPLAEDSMAMYLEAAYLSGRREEALKTYERFCERLRDDLGLEPLATTQHLIETIRKSGRLEQTPLPKQATGLPLELLRPPRLIGRELESSQFVHSNARMLLIKAEPGMGKTRFLAELCPQDALWLKGQEGLENIPFYPLLDYLQTVPKLPDLGSYQRDLARLIPERFPGLSPTPAEPLTAKTRLFEALARALSEVKTLVIDDLQWADEASLELLSFLLLRSKLRLLGTYRSTELNGHLAKALSQWQGTGTFEEISLLPLTEATLRGLVASLSQAETGPQLFVAWLFQRSRGNPFFALEILKALFEARVLQQKDGIWASSLDTLTQDYSELEAPKSLKDAVIRRIQKLPETVQRVLQVAAVAGSGFSPSDLAQLAGLSEWAVLEAFEQAESAGIVTETSFCHDLFRQTLYDQLVPLRKKAFHARIAELFADTLGPVVLADHYWAAGNPSRAGECYLEAAQAYKRKGLHSEAIRLLKRVIPKIEDETFTDLAELELISIGVELEDSPELEGLIAKFEAHPNPEYRSLALNNKAILLLNQGNLQNATEIYQAWLNLPLAFPEDIKIQQLLLKAQLEFYGGNYEATLKTSEETLELLKAKGLSIDLANTLTNIASALDVLERHREAKTYHLEAYRVAKALDAPHVQIAIATNILWNAMAASGVEEALALAEEALTLGDYAKSMTLRINLAATYVEQGELMRAEPLYSYITEHSADPTLLAIAWARLAGFYKQADKVKEALERSLKFCFETDFRVAHIRVGITVLNIGNHEQIQKVLPLLKGKIDFDTLTENELIAALANQGLSYPVEEVS